MADWPPSGMSNFGFPGFEHEIRREGPETLITRFDDGTELRRQKNNVITRLFKEVWEVNRDDAKTMIEFYNLKGMEAVFDKLALDPLSGDNFSTDLATVRWDEPIRVTQIGPKWFRIVCRFIEVTV